MALVIALSDRAGGDAVRLGAVTGARPGSAFPAGTHRMERNVSDALTQIHPHYAGVGERVGGRAGSDDAAGVQHHHVAA